MRKKHTQVDQCTVGNKALCVGEKKATKSVYKGHMKREDMGGIKVHRRPLNRTASKGRLWPATGKIGQERTVEQLKR